jgi:hypothetical protein
LQASLGMEPAIDGSADMPLAALSEAVGASLRQWNEGRPAAPAEPVPAGAK